MECPTHDASGPLSVPSAVDMLMKDLGDDALAALRATAYDDHSTFNHPRQDFSQARRKARFYALHPALKLERRTRTTRQAGESVDELAIRARIARAD